MKACPLSQKDVMTPSVISSLYLHIPFCARKCVYCDFFSVPYNEALALRYVDALVREIALRKDDAGELKTIYMGGGTPTTLPVISLVRLFKAIRDTFTPAAGAEVTIEANPGTLDREKVRALAGMGVNRLSLGVQSFDDNVLKLLGRVHTFEDVLRAVAHVRDSPVQNFSIDLIYGVPGQTLRDWEKTVLTAIELFPHHISAYELTPEKGTPLFARIEKGELSKPGEDSIIEMYDSALESFEAAGYHQYEISNLAIPGYECRHNLNYWNRGEYIGVGAGAHGFIGDKRMRNTLSLERYIGDVRSGNLPVEESTEISCEDAVKEFIFLGLRKTEGLDIKMFREELDIGIAEASKELIAEGLLKTDGARVKLTRKGLFVSNAVIRKLFEKLAMR